MTKPISSPKPYGNRIDIVGSRVCSESKQTKPLSHPTTRFELSMAKQFAFL